MLILSSCDFRNDHARRVILDHLPMPIDACRVLFIPNEKATSDNIKCKKYNRRLCEFGFSPENVHVFDHSVPNASRNLDIDAIYVSGGNSFEMLRRIRQSGFDQDIIQYVKTGVIYIGGSAGAHLASPDISHIQAFDPVSPGMTDFRGLELWNGLLICHYSPERASICEKLQRTSPYPLHLLTDDDAIVIP